MPLQRRVPKFGFTSPFKIYYQVVNVSSLEKLTGEEVTINAEILKKHGLIKSLKQPVKILGNGDLKVKLQIEVNAFSNSAKEKIEAAGGSIKKI
jgi:large subunit ribosomal protein L15